ncbi:MAG: SemiSWEET transporter [Candidatus Omnitrophota bacterium]
MMIINIIGLAAAVLTSFAFIPQLVRVVQTKSVKDLSPITLGQLTLGVSLWLVYGFLREDVVIILANGVTLLSLTLLWVFYFKFSFLKVKVAED